MARLASLAIASQLYIPPNTFGNKYAKKLPYQSLEVTFQGLASGGCGLDGGSPCATYGLPQHIFCVNIEFGTLNELVMGITGKTLAQLTPWGDREGAGASVADSGFLSGFFNGVAAFGEFLGGLGGQVARGVTGGVIFGMGELFGRGVGTVFSLA